MKIKKSPPKKLAAPDEIPEIVESVKEWIHPRGDLFHWIGVLNRFDTILENICLNNKLKKLQTANFSEPSRSILLAILKFSRLLLENCTNRNLYSSYEHLNDLLYTNDLEVLEVLLRLILRPAQRLSNQRALRTNFNISQDRILTLAHSWGTKEYDIEMVHLASDDVIIPNELTTLNYQFYRHLTPSENKRKDTATSTSSGGSNSTSKTTSEGVTLICVNDIHQYPGTDMDILNSLVQEYDIPEEFHYALLNRIRIVTSITSKESRRRFLIIRILAIAIMAHVIQEHVAQSKIFLYEPDIVANLSELVHPDRKVPFDVQTVAFYALDGISHYRSKLQEVLTAINASANHGILLYVLRKIIADLDSEHPIYPQDYCDSVFALITHIISTQIGGNMDEVDFGFQSVKDTQSDHMEDVTVTSSNHSSSIASTSKSIEPTSVQSANAETEVVALPYERSSLIKSMFKFVYHMMQSSGNADGLRNLIDTTLPESLKKVFEQPSIFGSSIYAHAINLIATFIHNEPTSLPIMQESKLPQTFLKSIINDIPASVDVIQSIPNAFGAICLNLQGMEIFNQMNPIDKFFSIFTSIEHLRALQDGDLASVLGTNIDELMRHHPSLKPIIMDAIMTTLKRIYELGQSDQFVTANEDTCSLHVGVSDDDSSINIGSENLAADSFTSQDAIMTDVIESQKSEEKKENIVVSFIEIMARFLEGLFQNQSHCKEFLKQDEGLNILLKYYSLPTVPYDFASSQASYSLSHLMRVITDVEPRRSVAAIISVLNDTLQDASPFLNYEEKSGLFIKYIDLKVNDTAKIEAANKTFRTLITLHGYVGLLSDVYCSTVFSHGKSVSSSLIEAFVGNDNEILSSLGKLHRTCVWENVVLKSTIPKSWYNLQPKSKKSPLLSPSTTSIFDDIDSSNKDPTTTNATTSDLPNEPPVDHNNRQVKNSKFLKFLISQIPSCLTPLFQGLAKMLFTRKSPDSNQRKQASKVSDSIASVLHDHLNWKRYEIDSETDSSNKYNYLTAMLGLLSLLFSDERNQVSLQTMLVVSFEKVGGLDHVIYLLQRFWEESDVFKESEECLKSDDKSKEKLGRIHECIKIILNFFQFVASAKSLHESSQTAIMTAKEKDPRFDKFDPYSFLVKIRSKILPAINELWQSSYLLKAPPNLVKLVIQNLVQILKADGEVNQRPEGSGSGSGTSSLSSATPLIFGHRNTIPDEDRVQQLLDMGFPRSAAEAALSRCNNHVPTAAEFLLTHPQTIAAAISLEASRQQENESSNRESAAITGTTTTNNNLTENTETESGLTTGTSASSNLNVDIFGTPGDEGEDEEDDASDLDEETSSVDHSALSQGLSLPTQSANLAVEASSSSNNDTSVPMETETTSDAAATTKKTDKGKGKETETSTLDQFKQLREKLKSNGQLRAIELLDQVEDIIFEIKDLFVLFSKDDLDQTIAFIIECIQSAMKQQPDNGDDESKKKESAVLSSRLRLLALLMNETTIQSNVSIIIFDSLVTDLFDRISDISLSKTKPELPKWLTPALLIVESLISLSDEPKSVGPLKTAKSPEDPINFEDTGINTMVPNEIERLNLLGYCLGLVRRGDDLDKDLINALLRIFVRLTRQHGVALEFMRKDGLAYLFEIFKKRAHDFRGQQIFLAMLMRHVIEDESVIENIMEREIKNWFTNPRPRTVDVNAYLKNTPQYALRNHDIFVKVTKKICKLNRYDPNGRTHQITLIKQGDTTITTAATTTHANEEEMITDVQASTSVPIQSSPKKTIYDLDETESLIQFISHELLSIVFKPEEHQDYLSRCFLLQCLTELLSSYPSCKMEVVNLSRRRNSVNVYNNNNNTKSKPFLLNHLLNEFLPYGCITPSTDIEMRKRYGQSKWTTYTLVALFRKFVLDTIIRSFKSAIASTDPIEAKYGRLLALAELCYALLTARASPNSANKPNEDNPASIARIMLDKNFVNILTDALAEIDLNYPSARILINALLKPFEFLTKVAIKLGRSPDSTDSSNKDNSDEQESISSISTPPSVEEMHPETEDAPDLYANSVLGALEGRIESDDDDVDTSGEEQAFEEDFEEESGNGDEDQEMWDVHDQVMIEPGDIREEAIINDDVEGHIHRHRHRERFGGDDDVGDRALVDSFEEERLNFTNWGFNQPSALFMNDDEFSIPNRAGRALFSFGNRRHRHLAGRRTILEVPSESFNYVFEDSDGYTFNIGGNDEVDIPGLNRTRPITSSNDDIITHPLLVNRAPTTPSVAGIELSRGRSIRNGPLGDWTHSIEELIGGGAVQLLEQLLTRGRDLNRPTYRLELNPGSSGLVSGIEVDRVFQRVSSNAQDNQNSTPPSDPIAAVQEFMPLQTGNRWYEEARMMYGSMVTDKATKLANLSQDTVMEEDEPVTASTIVASSTSTQVGGESSAQGSTETPQEQQQPPATRTTVIINGQPVDITDTGIDPTFLEALPEDLREEIINQHLPQRRTNTTVTGTGEISSEFLAALPDDLREELLQQEEAIGQQERRDRQRTTEPAAVEMDTASFFASLDPHLRQTVLLEQDDMVLASLPPAIAAEANALRERASRRYTNAVRSRTLTSSVPQIQTPKKPAVQRDAVKLVDTQGLSTLVRLLFLPQPLNNKNLLHKLLLNLCENSNSRGELVSMLLSVLFDGSGDVASVDKSFAQMSIKNKGSTSTKGLTRRHSGVPNPSLSQITQAAGENVPNLIAQRCLEALTFIVSYNEASVTYFLMEHENNIGLKRTNSRKGKEKQKSVTSKYPVVILLSLLDRQVFIRNTSLMEQLMTLLSFVLRPLSSIAKNNQPNTTTTNTSNTTNNNNTTNATTSTAVNTTTTSTAVNTTTTSTNTPNLDLIDITTSTTPQSSPPLAQNNNENTSSDQNVEVPENDKPATASSSKPPETEQQPKLKPPVIPEYCLRSVVNVMTVGECTGNTFKCTLTVIQYLSTLKGAREIITSELVDRAQSLGNEIHCDLDELAQILHKADTGVDVQGVTLAKFSPSSSKQAKLLRVLKTIDYMYSSGQQQQTNAQSNTQVVVAPTVDPEDADLAQPRTLEGSLRTSKLAPDEEKVMKIYESLSFADLWNKLGKCLLTIHEKQDMIHVATVLLPLIESLMVVCKYVGMTPPSGHRSNASENMENLFFSFTEEHRKILNTMVRNNPSLMSGSFSLLVNNPKILEFDNKRNYFNQQLHKRTNGREHYGTLQLNVRRQYVFEDSFQNLQRRTGDEIKYGKLSVRFYEEEGVDAGGVTREWFQVLARQMFNEDYALFKTSAADRLTYQPNRASGANPEHLLFFKFVGRVIGKAIYDGRLLDAYFTRSFYKHILGKAVDYRDVEAIDLGYYNSLVWMLNNDITNVVDLTFSVEVDDFGQKKIIDLKTNGRNITVTEENKREYVKLVTEQRLTLAIKDQIESFLSGFHEIIPANLIKIFNEQELELLISGLPDIDIDDWKNNTEYQNYTASSPQIQWFWRVVRSFSQEERAKLLQFVTGTSKVPLEGFSALQGVHGVQKFQIHKDFTKTNRLPSAHTCFNQLDIPEYESYEQLRQNLLLATSEGTTGFGFQ
nr:13988_t:CDS:10 [Entrophospora candida]